MLVNIPYMDPMDIHECPFSKDEWRIGSGFVEVYFVKSANVSYTLLDWILHRITEVVATSMGISPARRIDQPKPPGSNPILSYCCDRASKKACAFKFRPIGYFFMIYIDPIFFWLLVFLSSRPNSVRNRQIWGFQLPSTAESVMSHDGPYSKHPNCRPKTLRWLAGASTPGETHCDFNAPFFCSEGGKGMALWATASTKEITVCRSVLGGTSQLVSS